MKSTLREELAGKNIQLKVNEGITHAIVRMLVNAPEKTTWQLAKEYQKMNKEQKQEIQQLAQEILLKQKRKATKLRVGDTFRIDDTFNLSAGKTVENHVDIENKANEGDKIEELIPVVLSGKISGSHMIDSIDTCERITPTHKLQAKQYKDIPDTEDACDHKSFGGMSIKDKLGYTQVYTTKKGSPPRELLENLELQHDTEAGLFYIKYGLKPSDMALIPKWGKDEKNFFTLVHSATGKIYTAHLSWMGENKKDIILKFESS